MTDPRQHPDPLPVQPRLRLLPNDLGPLGMRKYPASPYPRPYSTVGLICGRWPTMGSITIPNSMSADEWDLMLEFLAVMRGAYVEDPT